MEVIWIVIIVAFTICILVSFIAYCYVRKMFDKISFVLNSYLINGIDSKKEMEESLESKISLQLRHVLEQAEHEKNSAEKEKKEVTELLSNLSHQLKTPLANLSMYIELLKEEELSIEEKQEFMIKISEQQQKMEWLTKMLVQISRLEVGTIEFEAKPNDLRRTLAASISMVYAAAVEKNILIILKEFSDCNLMHSVKWTKEVFSNILENAIKYSSENSKIIIKVVPMELYTKILISDEGIGIPKEEYSDIFKRFYRGVQVAEKEGTGLGLYLSQLILTKESGYLTVDSVVGEGSTFSVFLQNCK